MWRFVSTLSLVLASALPAALAQTMKAPDITREPTLYVVPYAHLDTQWRWEFPQTISEYLLKTMRVNFDYIEKYPHYVFNWTGANRYRLMKEYYPSDYAKIKKYVAEGRWYPAGSSVEEGDVNAPSAEAILRQILYGNTYFRREFGKASAEYMLPDCFGFPASLPSILAHAGVKGFSTQKLSAAWQPAPHVGGPDSPEQTPEGIPFNVGVWEGPDGKTVLAALNPESYTSTVFSDLSKEPPVEPPAPMAEAGRGGRGPREREQDWVKRIDIDGKATGVFADYHYMGTGDTGGAVRESSVKLMEAIVTGGTASLAPDAPPVKVGDGPVHVVEATADQMFLDIQPEMTGRMPRWKGDLELINHSAGSLTSEAYHKRWNRQNEVLADAAEKASLAAQWMGARAYPQQRLNNAWTLVMGGHFHDTMAGTATPRSYEFAWNDDLIARNQFQAVLADATAAVSASLDTQGPGAAVVVYNPLNIARQDVVEADVFKTAPKAVRVAGPDGQPVPAQIVNGKVLFLARMPSVGFAVYHVRPEAAAAPASSELKVTASSLENARYRVKINANGDVSSIFDKTLDRELLSAPIRLALSTDAPHQWPAWNMDWDQVHAAPRAYVGGPARIRVVENGPVRVAVEVTREAEGSKFVETVRLAAGDAGNRVEFQNAIDWRGLATNLKAVFPLTASNRDATYNWGIGTVERPTENERQFEVASHQWIDLTDHAGEYGATILTDCKNGSDKYDDHTIRLTLIRTPGFRPEQPANRRNYSDQLNQDWGHHEFVFGIAGHSGDWRRAGTDWQAQRLNDPLMAFQTASHAGALGREFSLLKVNNSRVRVMALKKAETSDEWIVRLVELDGKPQQDVLVSFPAPVVDAREVNGQEQPLGPEAAPAVIAGGSLSMQFAPYQPRTFAFKLNAPLAPMAAVQSQPVTLAYDLAAATNDDTRATGGFDGKGNAMPAEMLPTDLTVDGVRFTLAPAGTGKPDAVVAKGQTIDLPAGQFNRVWLLAASAEGDRKAAFRVGSQAVNLTIQDWGGFIGQWDTRIWKGPEKPEHWEVSANHAVWDLSPGAHNERRGYQPRYPEDYVSLRPGFLKPAELAWYCSHHHTAEGLNEPYGYSYLFAYPIDLPAGARTLTLPRDEKIRVLAVSVEEGNPEVRTASAELY